MERRERKTPQYMHVLVPSKFFCCANGVLKFIYCKLRCELARINCVCVCVCVFLKPDQLLLFVVLCHVLLSDTVADNTRVLSTTACSTIIHYTDDAVRSLKQYVFFK